MKIVQVVPYTPFNEGVGTVAYYYAKALQGLGVDIELIVPDKGLPKEGYDSSIYKYYPSLLSIQNAFLTPKLLLEQGFDILHLHNPYIFGSELIYLKGLFESFPLVVTYHNDLIGRGFKGMLFKIYQSIFTPLILNKANKITFNSFDHTRASVFAETVFRRKSEDLVEIPSGVDVDIFTPDLDASDIRREFGFLNDDIVILFVSSLDQAHVNKGLFLLLEAQARLSAAVKTKLLIVGDGEMRPIYSQKAAALGIADDVKFAGRVSHQALPLFLNAGNMIVIPAIAESFGLAIAEGMACGLPAIATDNPGVRVVIEEGETGFLVPYNNIPILTDKISQLANSPELRKQMGIKGRKRIEENFTWEIAARKLLAVYNDLQ
jgi:glycosyltransferase involved in cell wall biosynthesis